MTKGIELWQTFRTCWKSLVLADLLFKLVAYVFLTPAVGLVFQLFLWWSGHDILADLDIARFLVHPTGFAVGVFVAGAIVAVLALEQSVIMTIALASHRGRVAVVPTVLTVGRRGAAVFSLTWRLVLCLGLATLPFLAVAGAVYWLFLTRYDINFYLAERPAIFWGAAALIGVVLMAMLVVLACLVVIWSLALPLLLFEGVSPKFCLSTSAARTRGQRWRIAGWIGGWAAAVSIGSALATSLVFALARFSIPAATRSIWVLSTVIGLIVLFWFVLSVFESVLANVSFGVILAGLYQHVSRPAAFRLPEMRRADLPLAVRLTPGRVGSLLLLAALLLTLLGAVAIHQVKLEDRVEITAHRGGGTHAPENTLAAIRRAIEDRADWVEIDVQESRDGVVVVAHDSDLKRVAGQPVKIWEATAEELRTIDIGSYFDPRFREERVPTLAEVLALCKGRTRVNIELKYYGRNQRLEERVVELVEEHGVASDVVIMSLEAAGIRRIRELRPTWTVGILVAVAAGDLTRAEADFLAVKKDLATHRLVRAAHKRGKRVHAWTVNDAASMSVLIGRGVDNLITDDPALARQVLAERAAMNPIERIMLEVAVLFGKPPS